MFFCFRRRRRVREGTDSEDLIFREREITEVLVDFWWGASCDRLSVGSFGRGEGRVSYSWEEFCFVLGRSRYAPAARTVFKTRAFSLRGRLSWMERQGRGLRIDGFRGWVVVVIVGGEAAVGLHRIGTIKVSGITTSKTGFHTLRVV